MKRIPLLTLLATALLGTSLLVGCKNDKLSSQEYVDKFTVDVCQAIVECNCEYPYGQLYDHCLAQLVTNGEALVELNDVEGLSFDGECAQQAIDNINELGCSVPVGDPDAECEQPCKIWHGPMGEGGTCTSVNGYDNCKQGLVCGGDGVCVNPCAEPDLPNLNELCAPQYGCDEGLYCDAETTPLTPTCAALPNEGEPCIDSAFFGYLCNEDLFCDDVTDPDAPTCAALPGLDEECPDLACQEGLYCDTAAMPFVCADIPTLGEDCPNFQCDAPYQCEEGTCVEPDPAVCGYYGGLPADEGGTTDATNTTDPTTDTTDATTDTGGACNVDEVQCVESLECIPLTWVCDGTTDCADGSDEATCG